MGERPFVKKKKGTSFSHHTFPGYYVVTVPFPLSKHSSIYLINIQHTDFSPSELFQRRGTTNHAAVNIVSINGTSASCFHSIIALIAAIQSLDY